jgi:hypothetical protein
VVAVAVVVLESHARLRRRAFSLIFESELEWFWLIEWFVEMEVLRQSGRAEYLKDEMNRRKGLPLKYRAQQRGSPSSSSCV